MKIQIILTLILCSVIANNALSMCSVFDSQLRGLCTAFCDGTKCGTAKPYAPPTTCQTLLDNITPLLYEYNTKHNTDYVIDLGTCPTTCEPVDAKCNPNTPACECCSSRCVDYGTGVGQCKPSPSCPQQCLINVIKLVQTYNSTITDPVVSCRRDQIFGNSIKYVDTSSSAVTVDIQQGVCTTGTENNYETVVVGESQSNCIAQLQKVIYTLPDTNQTSCPICPIGA